MGNGFQLFIQALRRILIGRTISFRDYILYGVHKNWSCGKAVKHMLNIKSSLIILQLFILHFLKKICSTQYVLGIFYIFLNGSAQIFLQYTWIDIYRHWSSTPFFFVNILAFVCNISFKIDIIKVVNSAVQWYA